MPQTMKVFNPLVDVIFFDDFFQVDSTATTGKWIKSGVNTEVVAISETDDGIVSMATGGADNDTAELQTQGACLHLRASKTYVFETKFQSTTANATKNLHEWLFGFVNKDTTLLGTGVDSSTDYIAFQKDVGDNNIDLVIRQATGTIDRVAAIGTYADATNFVLRFEVTVSATIGTGTVRVFINGQPVLLGSGYEYSTTSLPTTVALAITMGFGAGSADVTTGLVDYVYATWPRAAA